MRLKFSVHILFLSLILISINSNGQRVGIGTTTPLARLAIDSGLMVDQLSANQGALSPGIIFGKEGLAGISSSRLNNNLYRNGLSFFTNGVRRMTIDSVGRVGIGPNLYPQYFLTIGGDTYISADLNVYDKLDAYSIDAATTITGTNITASSQLKINTATYHSTLLYLKGLSGTPGNWGMHIMMEDENSTDSGAIIYDGDMKFRTFGTGDNFVFRNEANSTTMSLDGTGDLAVTGDITTAGDGIVASSNGTQLKMVKYTSPANINFTLSPGGGAITFNIPFSTFASSPVVSPGQFTGSVTNASHLLATVSNVDVNSATITVRNVGTVASVGTNCAFNAIILGAR
ncbi:MAG: hypothetical protein V4556_12480 [Bacteroidota bacterium]